MGHGHAMWKHALTLQVSYCSPTKLNNRSIYGTSSHGQRVRVIFAASCKASLRQKRASLTTPVLAPANKPWRGSTQPARSHHKHAGTIFSANAFQCQVEHFRPSASEASRWTIQPTVPGRASAQGRQLQAQCLTGQQRKGREASEHMPPLPPLLLLRMLLAILDHLMTGLRAVTAAPAWTAQDDRQAVTESGADLEGQAHHVSEATHVGGCSKSSDCKLQAATDENREEITMGVQSAACFSCNLLCRWNLRAAVAIC